MEKHTNDLVNNLITYWRERSISYGKQHLEELTGDTKVKWQDYLLQHLSLQSNRGNKVLDIGTGPGFLAILLAEKQFNVTAIDLTEEMLQQAKKNAAHLDNKIEWRLMNAEHLDFSDQTFDVIVTRNLTWNLADPETAYREWYRVLKPGGILLNFDSNWYHYLFNEESRKKYFAARAMTKRLELKDVYQETNISRMEELVYQLPLSETNRPDWDTHVLAQQGFQQIETFEHLNDVLLNEVQKINLAFSSIFMIRAIK